MIFLAHIEFLNAWVEIYKTHIKNSQHVPTYERFHNVFNKLINKDVEIEIKIILVTCCFSYKGG